MLAATYLFLLATLGTLVAAFGFVWRLDREQGGAGWFAAFLLAGVMGIICFELQLQLTDRDPFTGNGAAAVNLLFAAAVAALARAVAGLFGCHASQGLTYVLPITIGTLQGAIIIAGYAALGGALMGLGAMGGFCWIAWTVRDRTRTAAERCLIAAILIGGLCIVLVPAVAASGALMTVELRAQVVPSFLALLIGVAALAVYLERIHAKLIAVSERDPLTGLLNRRGLDVALARRGDEPWSVLLVDLDHFKSINDRYGHAAGDEVLRATAAVLRGGVRTGDAVARTGGEEFLIAFPDTEPDEAARVGERIRDALARSPQPALNGAIATASLGVADWPSDVSFATATAAADRALYAAKRGGRNRVVVASEPRARPVTPTRPDGRDRGDKAARNGTIREGSVALA